MMAVPIIPRPGGEPLMPRRRAANLFPASYGSNERRSFPQVLGPMKTVLTQLGWKNLLNSANYLYANLGPVQGAIDEIARYSVGTAWRPQYAGKDQAWGDKAEEWLWGWCNICELRGQPFNFTACLFLASIALDRDGDFGCLLTFSPDGYPLLQHFPAHRIGQRDTSKIVQDGPYKGLEIQNGVVFNTSGRPVAYRVLGDEEAKDRFVSARDFVVPFSPRWFDQGRGITRLAHAIADWSDVRDIRDFTKLGVKIENSIAIKQKVAEQDTDDADALIAAGQVDAAGNAIAVDWLDGGAIHYLRAGAGEDIEAFEGKKPGNNWKAFVEGHIMRSAYAGLGWPIEFAWSMAELGGASVRHVVGKAQRTVEHRQMDLGPFALRLVGYAIAKAMKLGLLPACDDWFNWDFGLPPRITVDEGYQFDNELNGYRAGFQTLRDIYAKHGRDWQEGIVQKFREAAFIEQQSRVFNIPADRIQILTPNGNLEQNRDKATPSKERQNETDQGS